MVLASPWPIIGSPLGYPSSCPIIDVVMAAKPLLDQRALVTGGTRGIGRAIAETLLQAGARVAICSRSPENLVRAVEQMREKYPGATVIGRVADVSNLDEVEALFEMIDAEWNGLDILINNAGIGIFKPVAELTPEEWNQVGQINLTGAFYCSRLALHRFRKAGGGFIVNISSLAAKNPIAGGAAYNASKFGLNGFSGAMMLDHRYDNVRVCTIMPGSVDTAFGGNRKGSEWKIAPEDVANTVLFVLTMPARTLISAVEIRPSQPRR